MDLEFAAPAETRQSLSLRDRLRSSQAQTNVITPTESGHCSNELVLVTPTSMKEYKQGISVIRLVLPGNEPGLD